ncbi:interleukin-6 receptor subunit beta-like [Alligator sinensis]|uniref:Interleukin-6 receptor subunit beta-like n=1 Tax=Alligator sinensis TaxID=38654 RepID=A0A3Q0FYK7_ALLSI|nr:interleukin-6 receptor subunit beta-like [Alligator sinensis]
MLQPGDPRGNGTLTATAVLTAEQPRGELGCYLPRRGGLHLLGTAAFQAGAPPGSLRVQRCVSFWARNITCFWDPGPETHLPTTYTLSITEEVGPCRWKFADTGTCVSGRETRSCTVPVSNLFASFKVQLRAENPLGQASAPAVCVHGMSIVKLSRPEVSATANRSDCFHVAWRLPKYELADAADAQYEIRYRAAEEGAWVQVEAAGSPRAVGEASPFTTYAVQVRARYRAGAFPWSAGGPSWSDWSLERSVTTLPTDQHRLPPLQPLPPGEANGRILGYRLLWQRRGRPAVPACITSALRCALQLPAAEEHVFLLSAHNAAGESPTTLLRVPAAGAEAEPLLPLPVLVSPAGDRSLLLQWDPPGFPVSAYILEWGRAAELGGQDLDWRAEHGGINSTVLAEATEPGHLYSLTLYALNDGAVRAVGSVYAYSKQTAPLRAPALQPARVWKSQVEVQWQEPSLEERGGYIRNYTVSYAEQGAGARAVVVNGSIHRYLLTGLAPDTVVRVSVTATTDGGSTQGPILSIRTRSFDEGEVELSLSSLGVGLVLLIAASLACLLKHQLIQGYLWPQVPDPSKSHLASWMPQRTWLDLVGSREEQHEKQGAGSSHVALDSISRIVSSQQREQLVPTSLLEGMWALEVSSTGDKCQAILLPSEPPGLTPDTGAQDTAAYRSRVEYSTVVFWAYRDRDAPQPLPTPHGSAGPHPEPAASPGAPSPAAEDRDSVSPGEFPLLLTLVMEGGDVQPKGVPAVGSQGSLTP